MSAESMAVGPPSPAKAQRAVVVAFGEALQSENGGEVVIKSGTATGRVFVSRGRVAWATASTFSVTFGARLVNAGLASRADLVAVFEECRRTGKNFAEALVEWNIIGLERLRRELLGHVADAFREVLSWAAPTALFVPSSRSYQGPLTFPFPEVFDAVDRDAASGPQVPFELRAVTASRVVGQVVEQMLEIPGGSGRPAAGPSSRAPRPSDEAPAAPGPSPAPSSPAVSARPEPDAPPSAPPPAGARPEPTSAQSLAVSALAARLSSLEDYRTAGFCSLDGKLLGSDRKEGAVDPADVASATCHLLRTSRGGSAPPPAGAAEAVVRAEAGILVLRSIAVTGLGEIGAFLVLGPAGNAALARIQIDRLLPDIVVEIS